MRAGTQSLADVFSQRTDVRPRRTEDPERDVLANAGFVDCKELELLDFDVDGRALDHLTPTCHLVKLDTVNLLRRIHRRDLPYMTAEVVQRRQDLLRGQVPNISRRRKLCTGEVARVG